MLLGLAAVLLAQTAKLLKKTNQEKCKQKKIVNFCKNIKIRYFFFKVISFLIDIAL